MKSQTAQAALRFLGCLAVGCLPCLTSCDSNKQPTEPAKPTADRAATPPQVPSASAEAAPGLEGFQSATKPLLAWIEARKMPPKAGPVSPANQMAEFVGMVKAVKTDGLPSDLKEAWQRFVSAMTEVDQVFKSLPVGASSSPQALASAMTAIQPKLRELEGKVRPITKALAEIGQKHGIPGLEKLGPSEPKPRMEGGPPANPPAQPTPATR